MEYFVIALILMVAAAIVVLLAKRVASHAFRCRHCSKAFRIKWPRVLVTEHSGKEYRLVCPYCNTRDWCTEQKTQA